MPNKTQESRPQIFQIQSHALFVFSQSGVKGKTCVICSHLLTLFCNEIYRADAQVPPTKEKELSFVCFACFSCFSCFACSVCFVCSAFLCFACVCFACFACFVCFALLALPGVRPLLAFFLVCLVCLLTICHSRARYGCRLCFACSDIIWARDLLEERVALLLQPHEPRFFVVCSRFEHVTCWMNVMRLCCNLTSHVSLSCAVVLILKP